MAKFTTRERGVFKWAFKYSPRGNLDKIISNDLYGDF